MNSDNHKDTISVAVPPRNTMSTVVRLATSAVASRSGLNIDQIDDLNTALEELFNAFVIRHKTEEVNFCINYSIHPDRLEIVAEGCPLPEETEQVGRYSRFLLASLSDRMEEKPNPAGGFDVMLVKLLSSH